MTSISQQTLGTMLTFSEDTLKAIHKSGERRTEFESLDEVYWSRISSLQDIMGLQSTGIAVRTRTGYHYPALTMETHPRVVK